MNNVKGAGLKKKKKKKHTHTHKRIIAIQTPSTCFIKFEVVTVSDPFKKGKLVIVRVSIFNRQHATYQVRRNL